MQLDLSDEAAGPYQRFVRISLVLMQRGDSCVSGGGGQNGHRAS